MRRLWAACLLVIVTGWVEASEPAGIRLKWWSAKEGSAPEGKTAEFLLPWGASKWELFKKIYVKGAEFNPSCEGAEEEVCYLGGAGEGWFADFGESVRPASLTFGPKGLSRFQVPFASHRYKFFVDIMIDALGPGKITRSTVSNRMGARFDQEIRTWETATTRVELAKRGDIIDEGWLVVGFKPLAKMLPKTGEAPF